MLLSIIIPVFNEAQNLGALLKRIREVVIKRWEYEIILIDDASTDRSADIIMSEAKQHGDILAILKKVNRGKGCAVREGLRHASGDIIIIQDADLEYSPEDYPVLVAPIIEGCAEVVYGSRFLGTIKGMGPLSRFANEVLTRWTNALYGASLTDMETCYKVFRADVVRALPLEANRFDIETEVTAKLLLKGIKIMEVPIRYHARSVAEGKKISWRDGAVAMWSLLKYRLNASHGEAADENVVVKCKGNDKRATGASKHLNT